MDGYQTSREHQHEHPRGKVHPSYWTDEGHQSFTMDDPEHAFPLWEHATDSALDVIAVHKRCRLVASR